MINSAQQIFSIIKKKADSKFKDSLINVLYLKKSGYAVGELAEFIIVENINRKLFRPLSACHIGQKTKNKFDSKTDVVISLNRKNIPFSIKTGSRARLKIKNGISRELSNKLISDDIIDKREILKAIKKELSVDLYILHLSKKNLTFYIDLKKINLKNFDSLKVTKKSIILKDKNQKSLIFFDLDRLVIYAYSKSIDTIDSMELGKDNSLDKKHKGESLLINSIITKTCLCNIDTLRKIERIVNKKYEE